MEELQRRDHKGSPRSHRGPCPCPRELTRTPPNGRGGGAHAVGEDARCRIPKAKAVPRDWGVVTSVGNTHQIQWGEGP